MKERLNKLNKISVICFFVSSFSLVGISFIDFDNGMPVCGYLIACVFWLGLICGVILQIRVSRISKKFNINKKIGIGKKKLWIALIGIFFIFFLLILFLKRESITLLSIDLACLLFSFEIYFLKWRNDTE